MNLATSAAMWPTPTSLSRQGDCNAPGNSRSYNKTMELAEPIWSTPRASDGEKGGPNMSFGAGGTPLPAQAAGMWKTPRVMIGDYTRDQGDPNKPRPTLEGQAKNLWQTPAVGMISGGQTSRSGNRKDEMLINGQADQTSRLARPVPETSTDGVASSTPRRSLNPLFVEWLMNWPTGWTALAISTPAPTGFACSETELSHWKRRMRFELSALALAEEAPSVQPSLL